MPEPRKAVSRTPPEVLEPAVALKRETPARGRADPADSAHDAGLVAHRTHPPAALRRGGLTGTSGDKSVFGRFEATRGNELWTGDALHGPKIGGRKTMSRTWSSSRYSVERPAHRSCGTAVKFSSADAVVGGMSGVRRAVFAVLAPQMVRPGARALRPAIPLAAAGAERSTGEVTPMCRRTGGG
nr:hypothetical protein [Streptomyces sp. CBMA152]